MSEKVQMNDWLKNNFEFNTFDQSKEIKSGDILLLKGGEIYLVGDVNPLLGICDDCTEFRQEDIEKIANIYHED